MIDGGVIGLGGGGGGGDKKDEDGVEEEGEEVTVPVFPEFLGCGGGLEGIAGGAVLGWLTAVDEDGR